MFKKIRLLWYTLRLKDMCTALARVEKCRVKHINKIDSLSKKIKVLTDSFEKV